MLKLVLNKFKLKQVILSSFVLLVSFAAALTATFAWFTVNRNAHAGTSSIKIDDAVESYKFKYYAGNYSTNDEGVTKYTGYQDLEDITSVNYDTDFIDMDVSLSSLWNITDMFPSTRYSFSVEITMKDSNITKSGLAITKFSALNKTYAETEEDRLTIIKVDKETGNEIGGIYLSEAINVFSTAFIKPDSSSTINTYSYNFIQGKKYDDANTPLIDVFNESGDGSSFGGCDLATVTASSLSNKTVVVLFTIEFSDNMDTYYSYYSRSGNNVYYYKDEVNGSSNCYQLLNFSLKTLSLFAQ